MKIAQLVSNYHTVSPLANHAIYSHVASLTDGLTDLGHSVTLFAAGDSKSSGKLVSSTPRSLSRSGLTPDISKHYIHRLISKCYEQASDFDIIHSHFTLLSSFYSRLTTVPTVQSIHSPISDDIRPLLLEFKDNRYISFTYAQRRMFPELNWIANIYHGVDMKTFTFNPTPKDYFLYLGRITEDKGVHLAIEAAKAAGVPLRIAGTSYPAEGYWHEKIEPFIDGKTVKYVGEAQLEEKIELLRNAKAILFPTQVDEVFGYVMIEAMACGTPVIGWNSGSVPEVVSDKTTGYIVKSVKEMVRGIKSIDKISRKATRDRAERLFSVEKMVSGYQKVYTRVLDGGRVKNKKAAASVVLVKKKKAVKK